MNKPCCPLLEDVASRAKSSDRMGLMFDTNLMNGKRVLNIWMRKAKKAERPETWKATYAVVRYCPFCGAKVEKNHERAHGQ